MSTVYNPEADVIARIEALELEARELRQRLEHVRSDTDKKVMNRQLGELKDEIQFLRNKVDKVGIR